MNSISIKTSLQEQTGKVIVEIVKLHVAWITCFYSGYAASGLEMPSCDFKPPPYKVVKLWRDFNGSGTYNVILCSGGKFGNFGESSAIHQTKPSNYSSTYNYNLLADLFFH